MKRFKIFIAFYCFLLALLFNPASLFAANPLQNACNGNLISNQAQSSPTCRENNKQNGNPTNPVLRIIREGANLVAVLAGIVAVITIIYAGFNFVTSGGNEEAVKSARSKIEGSLIGLIIIAIAWLIVTITVKLAA